MNVLVPGKYSLAEILEKNEFSYDPENVVVDGFTVLDAALHKPIGKLGFPEKIRVSVTAPKKEQEAV